MCAVVTTVAGLQYQLSQLSTHLLYCCAAHCAVQYARIEAQTCTTTSSDNLGALQEEQTQLWSTAYMHNAGSLLTAATQSAHPPDTAAQACTQREPAAPANCGARQDPAESMAPCAPGLLDNQNNGHSSTCSVLPLLSACPSVHSPSAHNPWRRSPGSSKQQHSKFSVNNTAQHGTAQSYSTCVFEIKVSMRACRLRAEAYSSTQNCRGICLIGAPYFRLSK